MIEVVNIDKSSTGYHIEEAYYGQDVYLVIFQSRNNAIIGDVQKPVDKDTYEIVRILFKGLI